MTNQPPDIGPDFFISYTAADQAWAEWIAGTLEANGHSCIIQAWDFRPGTNFVAEMHRAASRAGCTIAVLSPAYMQEKPFSGAEWAAAFADDPEGQRRKLVPVRVEECRPEGLLRGIVRIDLVGLDEAAAAAALLRGVAPGRAKPPASPFPGAGGAKVQVAQDQPFPGDEGGRRAEARAHAVDQALHDAPDRAEETRGAVADRGHRPVHPRFRSIGGLFKGRESEMEALRCGLTRAGGGRAAITNKAHAVHGLGGVGKTRLAVEYGRWQGFLLMPRAA